MVMSNGELVEGVKDVSKGREETPRRTYAMATSGSPEVYGGRVEI